MKKYLKLYYFLFLIIILFSFSFSVFAFSGKEKSICVFFITPDDEIDKKNLNTFSILLINELINYTDLKVTPVNDIINNDIETNLYNFNDIYKKYFHVLSKFDYIIYGNAFYNNGNIIITISIFKPEVSKIISTVTMQDSIDFLLFIGKSSLVNNMAKEITEKIYNFDKTLIINEIISKPLHLSINSQYNYGYDLNYNNNVSTVKSGLLFNYFYNFRQPFIFSTSIAFDFIIPFHFQYDSETLYYITGYSFSISQKILIPLKFHFSFSSSLTYYYFYYNNISQSEVTILQTNMDYFSVLNYVQDFLKFDLSFNYKNNFFIKDIYKSGYNIGLNSNLYLYSEGKITNKEYYENVIPENNNFSSYPIIKQYNIFPSVIMISPFVELLFSFNKSYSLNIQFFMEYKAFNNIEFYNSSNSNLPFYCPDLTLNSSIKFIIKNVDIIFFIKYDLNSNDLDELKNLTINIKFNFNF